MQSLLRRLSAVVLTCALGACATVTRGTTAEFTVESTPPGARAQTSTGFSCDATPCTFRMPRKDAFVLTVSKTGYVPATVKVRSKLAAGGAAGFLGNAVIGGVIGAGVDVASGAMLDLSPNPAHVTLEPEGAAHPAAPGAATSPAPAAVATAANAPPPEAPTPIASSAASTNK